MTIDPADTIELTQLVSALLATLFTLHALHACYRDLQTVITAARPELRPVALRRMRQQGSLLLLALDFLIAGFITIFLPMGTAQSAVRSFAMAMAALIVLVLSLTDHLEAARTGVLDPRRRSGDAPLSPQSDPGDRRE